MAYRDDEDGFDGDYDDGGFLQYQQSKQSAMRGRDSFIPNIDSPGPAAYSPNQSPTRDQAPRAAFGTSKRENEAHRFISNMHAEAVPPTDTPGPGTYRLARADHYPRSPTNKIGPSWKFGTGPMRLDPCASDASRVPGPIYNQEPPKSPIKYSFAPLGSTELGMARSRGDTNKVFISAAHASCDRTTLSMENNNVGPGMYDTPAAEVASPKRRAPVVGFARADRDTHNSMSVLMLRNDPLSTEAARTPGAVYDLSSALDTRHGFKFGKAVKIYSPERGEAQAGPYISRLHEISMAGAVSPGPGAYRTTSDSGRGAVAAPAYRFGHAVVDRSLGRPMQVPGPGAYNPKEDTASRALSAPAYSIASNLRTDFTAAGSRGVPGPGAYDVVAAARMEGKKPSPPAYSLGAVGPGGRSSFVRPSTTPGPNSYLLPPGVRAGPGQGYSFGLKERTKHADSTVSIRYHGPLAAQEGMGTESPGPGVYDVRNVAARLSTHRERPASKFGTGNRDVMCKIYISGLHSLAEGQGLASPGPGAYDHAKIELADVTSRYRKPAAASFGTSARFKTNYMTK